MKDLREWISVKNLYSKWIPIRQIARDLKMSRNTVRRLIKCESEPEYKKRNYETKIDIYSEQIQKWYFEPQYDLMELEYLES